MNGLFEQLFTPISPIAQLAEHKTEDLRRPAGLGSNLRGLPNFRLNFLSKLCHYLLVLVVIQLFSNE